MDKEMKNKKRFDLFVSLTRNKAKKIIKEREKAYGRKLEKNEKSIIVRNVARTARGRAWLGAMFAAGLISGTAGTKLLSDSKVNEVSKNDNEITVDLEESNVNQIILKNIDENTQIYVEDNTADYIQKGNSNQFIQGIKVDQNEIGINESIKENTKNEVESLRNHDQTIEFLKEICLEEYKIGSNDIEDISIYKKSNCVELYEDILPNNQGKIIRERYNSKREYDSGLVSVSIELKDGTVIKEQAAMYNGKYTLVYDENEEVVELNNNAAILKVAGVLDKGIKYATALENKDDINLNVMEQYEDDFKAELKKYKEKEIQNIVQSREQEEKEL